MSNGTHTPNDPNNRHSSLAGESTGPGDSLFTETADALIVRRPDSVTREQWAEIKSAATQHMDMLVARRRSID